MHESYPPTGDGAIGVGKLYCYLENIKSELVGNELLARDFPQVVGRGLVWRSNMIVLRNGVTIEALGTGQRLRGRRHRQHRRPCLAADTQSAWNVR